jgi:uncharacterized caspase-like protein
VGPLKNPHNDVGLIGAALGRIGFEIGKLVKDASREQILLAVHDFADRLKAAGAGAMGFVYYSGHGAAIGGDNMLVPVNVKSASPRELGISGVKLADITSVLNERAPQAVHFIVFDACRNNLGGSRGAKGFVPVAERPGMLVAFSTAPGTTASDEGRESGPYALALAAEIVVPGRNHDDMFFEVRRRVAESTRQEQIPWTQDGLLRQVHFRSEKEAAPGAAPVDEAGQVWAVTKDTTSKSLLEAFIARYQDTFYAELARARLRQIEEGAAAPTALTSPGGHPFDGVWIATWTGQNCPLKGSTYNFYVANSVVQPFGAQINGKGETTYVTAAATNPNAKVRHSIKLTGDAGTGSFQTFGHPCAGTEVLKRTGPIPSQAAKPSQQGPVGPAPQPTKAHPFDGTWEVTFTGGEACNIKLGTYRMQIAGSTLEKWSGSVNADGETTFITPSMANPDIKIRHSLKLAKNAGTGKYEAIGTPCTGTEVLKRIMPSPPPQAAK